MEQGIALSALTFNGKICAMNITWGLPSKQPKQFFKLFFIFSLKLFVLPIWVSHVSLVIFYERI